MKAKELRDLIDFIAQSGLAEVNIETEEFKISVKRHSEAPAVVQSSVPVPPPVVQQQVPAATPAVQEPQSGGEAPAAEPKSNKKLLEIKSPMIGTFYRAPNPDAEPFVKVGDVVKKGQVVCIIEAMKLFNEIESEVEGRIVEVLVENATPVEYDQPLFLVEPLS
ncbi:acetyl-CoA carboxylase biotin carboxyl carrier protein [Thermonema rossianum]|uniref:acetyl-CoA carboxylase biotin carboxyl carrier protein n=1 Tax=Thermonema rossianum TaxID=55505 RepID=UPI0005702B45|nr:acetyl-CoA carboxylase biotin carboxyl carrier protein [Thermonema rossianum]